MGWVTADRIERGVDLGAAATFAAAMAIALVHFQVPPAFAAGGAAAGFLGCFCGLRTVDPSSRTFALPRFAVEPFELDELDELLLTDADRLTGEAAGGADELLLEDVLAAPRGDSRVVRLFDPAAMPAPANADPRISPQTAPPDASRDLYEALAKLRKSLR